MLKFKRKLLAAILGVSIVLSSGVVWSEGTDDTQAPAASTEEGGSSEEGTGGDEEAPAAPVTEEEALAEMKEIAKSDSLTLYFNETKCFFAVKNNKSGYIWWSTPYDYESDAIAKEPQKATMASLFTFKPLDVENNSLPDSAVKSYDATGKSVTFETEYIENGVKITYSFIRRYYMEIPISIVLDNDRLKIRIICDEIKENTRANANAKEYRLVTLDLAQTFGAGRSNSAGRNTEEGYLLVPDGSGAVIRFDNGKNSTAPYKSKVYGKDSAINTATAPAKTEQTYLPIIGIVKEFDGRNEGMLAVVSKGDAYASVNAYVKGQSATEVNSAWFSFDFRANDTFTMGAKTDLKTYQSGENRVDDVEVSYYFLSGENVGAADLADCYRNYLINEKGLTKQSTDNSSALTVTTMGGTITKKSILGLPVDQQTVATSYEQAQEILQKLKDLGVDNIQLIYNDFTASGIKGEVTVGADYSGKLGGKNDFKELYEYSGKSGVELVPSVNFMEYSKSGNGYSFTLNSSKRVTKAYATQTDFDRAFGIPDTEVKPTWTILSPYYWPDVFNKIVKSFNNEGLTSISLTQATSLLYSDFSRKNVDGESLIVRQDSIDVLTTGYKQLNDAGISIVAQECNAYALPYVSSITNVPLYSSNYDMFDYDVPFYQMVIHGYIPYSSKAVNASSSANELRLLSLMTGSAIHYDMMYNSPNDFQDSEYDKYYYTNYEGWSEIAANDYKMYNDIASGIKDATIVDYIRNGKKNFTVKYSDGTEITVDTENITISVNGQEKNLADYGLKGVNN